ncbi:RHS repeat-associated core domain-containing protein [Limisphaera ngatamarikiensis]|uniref:RHS repeat-associated core domain-containing protein n=1 Tax=Limisphaera ngatamarikiensis TaxID=1324935 RepID=UPI003CCD6CF9
MWNLVSASTSTETARYEYGPFGEPLRLTGAAAGWNPFRFSTKRTEDATGLVLYEYRAYSPTLGRWLSRDPIEEKTGVGAYHWIANVGPGAVDIDGRFSATRCSVCGQWYQGYHPCPGSPPSPPPQPPSSQPQQSQYPEGFALCRRDIDDSDKKFLERLCTRVLNECGGLHMYVQYYKSAQDGAPYLWGWGFSGGEVTTPEKHFNPSVCFPCKKNGTPLKHGSGAGKPSTSASDEEIMDCIKNRKPDRRYTFPTYVCSTWAKQAVRDCGLTCQ